MNSFHAAVANQNNLTFDENKIYECKNFKEKISGRIDNGENFGSDYLLCWRWTIYC
ncbi:MULTISPECIES: hypothetical protein [unclassified Delftia]|uniref:hypothetical protein n=1 Tax=unclassified Delftia TaxID=2613839 RepID=UPI0012E0B03B|nr:MULTISPECIES: hypothetical protein [unclassified Delftia]